MEDATQAAKRCPTSQHTEKKVPQELWDIIFGDVLLTDLLSLRLVARRFQNRIDRSSAWKIWLKDTDQVQNKLLPHQLFRAKVTRLKTIFSQGIPTSTQATQLITAIKKDKTLAIAAFLYPPVLRFLIKDFGLMLEIAHAYAEPHIQKQIFAQALYGYLQAPDFYHSNYLMNEFNLLPPSQFHLKKILYNHLEKLNLPFAEWMIIYWNLKPNHAQLNRLIDRCEEELDNYNANWLEQMLITSILKSTPPAVKPCEKIKKITFSLF